MNESCQKNVPMKVEGAVQEPVTAVGGEAEVEVEVDAGSGVTPTKAEDAAEAAFEAFQRGVIQGKTLYLMVGLGYE